MAHVCIDTTSTHFHLPICLILLILYHRFSVPLSFFPLECELAYEQQNEKAEFEIPSEKKSLLIFNLFH